MTATDIATVQAWEALDSRGRPTVGCRVNLRGGASGRVVVPSGASTGSHEAVERRDGGERYRGNGVRLAVRNAATLLADAVHGLDALDQNGIDDALTAADDDPLLSGVGANAALAVSLATMLAGAAATNTDLWTRAADPRHPLLPMPMVNIVSGGAHAGHAIDIQDVLAVPIGARCFAEAIEWVARVRTHTAELLTEQGYAATLVADEGGLAAPLASNEAALQLVTDAVARSGLEPHRDIGLAVDVAANQLESDGSYRLASEDRIVTPAELVDLLTEWAQRYPVISWEDVLAEDDWDNWHTATERLGEVQLIGDDLFATNQDRLEHGIALGVANAVLIKPNQAGTISAARRTLERARGDGYRTVLSARSGDTEDNWLADLAVAWSTGQIKVGSLTRAERTAKWNRLLEIEACTPGAEFAGADVLRPGARGGGP